MNGAEILHLPRVTWRRWMQKFCTTLFSVWFTTVPTTNGWCRNSASQIGGLKDGDAEILRNLIFSLIHYYIYNKWMMQKFCISNQWLEKCGCRNSAQPYFLLSSPIYLQQMNDAEILHLRLVGWKLWMQKFCMTFFPLNSLRYLQQINDVKILHLLSVAWKMWMHAEILHDLIFRLIH